MLLRSRQLLSRKSTRSAIFVVIVRIKTDRIRHRFLSVARDSLFEGFQKPLLNLAVFFYDIPDDACIYGIVVMAHDSAELSNGMKVDVIRHRAIKLIAEFPRRFRNSFQTSFNGVDSHPVIGECLFR